MKLSQRLLAVILVLTLVCTPLLMPNAAAAEHREGYLSLEEAAEYVRKELAAKNTEISVQFWFDSPYSYSEGALWELLKAEVMKHTGVPNEGDYLYWSFQTVGYDTSEEIDGQTHYVTFHYISPIYNASKEQEQELDVKLAEVLASLELDSKTDYEKVEAICKYVCENVIYSPDVVADEEAGNSGFPPDELLVYYSAYGALVLGEATCQGYSTLIYRMMLELGIDCRLIAGDNHGWNIVKLGDLYYYLDTTGSNVLWETEGIIQYFLNGSASFRGRGHQAWTDTFNQEFLDQYPISVLDYHQTDLSQQPANTVIGSGQCGNNVRWQLTANGKLTISGSGQMYDKTPADYHWGNLNGYIRSVEVQEGVTSIGNFAFFNCPQLEEISIANTVEHIGTEAFAQCENLKHLSLGENVTSAGEYAFGRCVRLESVTLPSSLKQIPQLMFADCTSLKTVYLSDGIEVIGENAFFNCPSLVEINIPASVTVLEPGAFARSFDPEAKISFTIPETVKQVGWACFECTGLKEIIWNAPTDTVEYAMFNLAFYLENVVFCDTITVFERWVFHDCNNLKSVQLPSHLEDLGEEAFQHCISLEQITLPDSLSAIPRAAFIGCHSLKQLTIPENVKEIGIGAFNGCSALDELIIPAAVRRIGEAAFIVCPNLQLTFLGDAPTVFTEGNDPTILSGGNNFALYYPADNETWTVDLLISFNPDDYLCYAYYPDGTVATEPTLLIPREGACGAHTRWSLSDDGVLTISGNGEIPDYPEIIQWYRIKPYVKKVIIEEGVTRIGHYAFSDFTELTHITIADSVRDIGYGAFVNTALEVVIFQGDAPNISSYAFPQNIKFAVYYPKGNNSYDQALRAIMGAGAKTWNQMHAATEDHTLKAASYDRDQHSISCTGCPEVFLLETHRYSDACDETCDDCGTKRSVPHNFGGKWLQDESRHWQECADCGMSTSPKFHSYGSGVTQGDLICYSCKSCGYEKTEAAPMKPEDSQPSSTSPATQPQQPAPITNDTGFNSVITVILVLAVVGAVGTVVFLKKRK